MRFLNIFLILSAISSFSCQTKQKVRELSEPQELVSNDERKKQPERPDYAIKAPDFELRTIKGDIVKLSDLKGKVVLLNFGVPGAVPVFKKSQILIGYTRNITKRVLKLLELLYLDLEHQILISI